MEGFDRLTPHQKLQALLNRDRVPDQGSLTQQSRARMGEGGE